MREIKFRIWDKDLGMDYSPKLGMGNNDLNNQFATALGEIMQYTGLRDKNGKEIYEGDIYNYENDVDVFESIEDLYFNELIKYRLEDGEIIGNKFENPELLSSLK